MGRPLMSRGQESRSHVTVWVLQFFHSGGDSRSDVGLAFKCSLFNPIRSRDKCVFVL